jgi:ATP-dependent helicase/nuclease subunit A
VLCPPRDAFVEEQVRELKQRNEPDARGVDRMVLTEQLAVMDLVALGQFLLLPDDEPRLATSAKSPFHSPRRGHLYALRPGAGRRIVNELRGAQDESRRFAARPRFLPSVAQAISCPPYELYADLLYGAAAPGAARAAWARCRRSHRRIRQLALRL